MEAIKELRFIPLAEEYIELIRTWRNSKEVSMYMYNSNEITPEQQIAWYASVKDDASKLYWIIEYKGTPIGLVNLYSINPNFKSCYWAFYLGDTSVRGAGIGAKVEYSVLRYVFEVLKLNKLLCEVFVFNESVIQLHEKFGFRRESYFRNHVRKDGKYLDVVGLAMLKDEWTKIQPSFSFILDK